MAESPDYVFHLVTGSMTEGGAHNPIMKSMQREANWERSDAPERIDLPLSPSGKLDRVLVVVVGNQDTAEWDQWPELVGDWFWKGAPDAQFQPALTTAKSAPLRKCEASLKKPIVMTNRGIVVEGEKVGCFHVLGCPAPNKRGSRACGMQFLDELWDSARDAQARLTAFDDSVRVHLYLSKSEPETVGLVHKWGEEKGIEMPEWLSAPPPPKKKTTTISVGNNYDVCPGMDLLENILKPAELELLQTQYEGVSGGQVEPTMTQVKPILCTAGRFAKIKAAVQGVMPDELFGLMFAAASTTAPVEEDEEELIVIEEIVEESPPRLHPRDRIGTEITDLRSVIGGGGGGGNSNKRGSALNRLGSPVARNPVYDDAPPRRTGEPRRASRSSPSAWTTNRAPRDMLRRSRSPPSRRRRHSRSPERDELVLVRREKDVYMIKNESAYLRYLQKVPVERRTLRMPWTPEISRKMSGDEWDRSLMDWRRDVHQFDPYAPPPPRIRSRSPLRSRSPSRMRRNSGPGECARKPIDPQILEGRKRLMNDIAWKFPRFKIVYDKYVKTIPKEQRRPDMPRTPDIHQPNYVNSKEFSNQARNHQPILPDSVAE